MTRSRRLAATTGALLLAISSAGLVWWWTASEADPPDLSDPALIAEGQEVYMAHCAECHGKSLEGHSHWRERRPDGTLHPPPHDATGHTWHHPDSLLFQITKHGGQKFAPADFRSGMPAFDETLSDRQIWATLAYIKSTWPEEIQERQKRLSER